MAQGKEGGINHVSKELFIREPVGKGQLGLWITLWINCPRLPSGTRPVALRAASFRT
jgi:hypothetical protein